MLSDLAFFLAERGERVMVIASRQRYDDAAARLPSREDYRGVEIRRVSTSQFGRATLPGRAADLISFYGAAGMSLLHQAGRNDVVVAMTDPPLLSALAVPLAFLTRSKVVNWIQDLYPEIAVELGVPGFKGPLGRALAAIRDASVRRAAMNVAIGGDMAQRLRAIGVPAAGLKVIANWSDDEAVAPIAVSSLREAWGLTDKVVVAYSGNLGRAHDIETFLGAAERLRERRDIVFLFVGSGHGVSALASELQRRGLTNVQFRPYQPRELLAQSLAVGDIHWLSLKSCLDGLILPSKFYGIAAAGRPIIVVGSRGAELGALVTQNDCGFSVALGDSEGFAQAVATLANDRDRRLLMGQKARGMLNAHFRKVRAVEQWHDVLRTVMCTGGAAG